MKAQWPVPALALGVVVATLTHAAEIRPASEPIPDSWVIVLEDGAARFANETTSTAPSVEDVSEDLLAPFGARATHVYAHALKGFAVRLNEEQVKLLATDARINYIQQDGAVRAEATQAPVPSWGLDRIDQRNLPLNDAYTYDSTGAGVHAYVIDSGIYAHSDFAGRLGYGYTAIYDGLGTSDCYGHGTHVAGTIGGSTNGVAKLVTLHPVRVFDCRGSGSWSGVIAGVDWVKGYSIKPAVANMSLGGPAYPPVDTAVTNSINSGVTYVVAAGNDDTNACNYSPARVPAALTVGATTSTDARAIWGIGVASNWGACLDIFAPGDGITSSWFNGGTTTMSGTSMASPHVAGVAALYLQAYPAAAPATVASAIINNATSNVVTNPGTGSPNRLLYPPLTVSLTVANWILTCNVGAGTPPYSYRWYVRYPDCDPCALLLKDGGSTRDGVAGPDVACDRPSPNLICPWQGPYYQSPPNQFPYDGAEAAIRCDVTDSAGASANALWP